MDHNFSFYGSLDKFEEAADMTAEETALFQESCFGQFLKLPKINRSSKIINHLLMRVGQYEGRESEDALFIELGGEPRAFTIHHFAEITGLRIVDNYEAVNYTEVVEDGLFTSVFNNGTYKTRGVLTSQLKESKGWENPTKRVKLLLLHFLINVLLAAAPQTNIPDWAYVRLVEDLDQFNSHSWGNVVWKFFLECARKYIKNVSTKSASKGKINFPSFMYPLQIWAFETMPVLTSLSYCEKVSETTSPLLRRWKSVTHVVDNKFQHIDFQSENLEFKPLGSQEYFVRKNTTTKPLPKVLISHLF